MLGLLLAVSALPSAAEVWELYDGLYSAERVEIVAPAEVRAELRPVFERLLADDTWETEWSDPTEEAAGSAARVVLGTLDTPGVEAVAEALGVARVDRGFRYGGLTLRGEQDAAVLTGADPARRGLPVTLWLVNDLAYLRGLVTDLTPVWRPGHTVYQRGYLERRGPGQSGRRDGGDPGPDYGAARERLTDGAGRVRRPGLLVFLPGFESEAEADPYLEAVVAARRRALEWIEPETQPANSHLMLYAHPDDWVRTLGPLRRSAIDPTGRVHAVVHPDLPHDGGRAVVEALLLETLGPPAEEWMLTAVAVDAADSWWGVPLEEWCARLARLGYGGAPRTWRDTGRSSPHIDVPLSALWVRCLRESRGASVLRDFWTGARPFEPDPDTVTLEEGRWYNGLSEPFRERYEALEATVADAPRPTVEYRRGICLAPGEGGLATRALETSLQRASELGATDVTLTVATAARGWEREYAGEPRPQGRPGDPSDTELAFAARTAQRLGFATLLSSHLWSTPSGPLYGEMHLVSPELATNFFNIYQSFAVHYALLAELLDCETYCFGSGLAATASTAKKEGTDEDSDAADLRNLRRQRWVQLARKLRLAYDGALVYAARDGDRGWAGEAELVDFWGELDAIGIDWFMPLDRAADPNERPNEQVQRARLLNGLRRRCELAEELDLPLVLTSIGFPSVEEAWRHPWSSLGAPDPEEQARLYGSLGTLLPNLRRQFPEHFRGLYLWEWSADPDTGGSADAGFTPQGKPAEGSLAEIFQ